MVEDDGRWLEDTICINKIHHDVLHLFFLNALAQELSAFAKVLETPAKPVLAILGGAKVSRWLHLSSSFMSCVLFTKYAFLNTQENLHKIQYNDIQSHRVQIFSDTNTSSMLNRRDTFRQS